MICLHHLASSSKSQTLYPFHQLALLPKTPDSPGSGFPSFKHTACQTLSTQKFDEWVSQTRRKLSKL